MIDERAKINVQLNYSISWKRKLNGNYLCLAPEDFTVVTVMLGVIDRLKLLAFVLRRLLSTNLEGGKILPCYTTLLKMMLVNIVIGALLGVALHQS